MSRSTTESRRLRSVSILVPLMLACAVELPLGANSAFAQDRTAAWLEARGLDELLATHLETALEAARGDQSARERIAGRLARTYARMLRAEDDEGRRATIVERSERMIGIVPHEDAGELRVALVRNRYIRASRILEDDRIGVAEAEEVAKALGELKEIAREIGAVRDRAEDDARQASRARGRRAEDRIERALDLAANAGLIEGWSRYYLGRASGDRAEFEKAQLALGSVLQGDSPIPELDEVSIDLQAADGFANAMLANAMVTASLASPEVAERWFARLEMSVTHESIRGAVPGWWLASLIDAREFRAATALFAELTARARTNGDQVLPLAWIRIAAVGSLRRLQSDPAALPLAEAALAEFAGRGELAEVRTLAADFGLDALGDRGFVFGYVRGVDRHRTAIEAREAGDLDAAVTGFSDSVQLLRRALKESDATLFPEALGAASMLIGWNLLELDRPAEAADAFEEAAGRMSGDRRADAFWGAIVALDRIVSEGGAAAVEASTRRDALAERFLDSFPADDRAPSLVVRRIAEREEPDSEDLQVLLGVPDSHPTWEIARRRAVQALYREFRSASEDTRAESGRRMLQVADELLQRDRSDEGLFTDVRGLDGMLLRQAAEVASDERVRDGARAERYLEQLESALQRGALAEVPDLPNEIQYRRLGVALGDEDFEYAGRLLAQLPVAPETPEAGRWVRLGALRVHQSADRLIRSGPVSIDVARASAEAGARYLELAGLADDEQSVEQVPNQEGFEPALDVDRFAALDRDRMLPIAARVAAARAAVFAAGGDRADGEEALAWYRAVLDRRPLDGGVLEAVGRLGEALGENDVALDAWRRLARAAPDGEERWWRGKVGQIRVQATLDPETARMVFDQLKTLYPDLGPDPWNQELRDLDIRIEVALRESSPASGDVP